MSEEKYIVHIDMDAFFASIEQRDNPGYRGKPVIVGADPRGGTGRGVVSTCSYEARVFGIHSAMPISVAYKKCPHGIFVKPAMEKYAAVSEEFFAILYSFTPDVAESSVDEAFMDITGSYHLFAKTPQEVCCLIKKRIRNELGLIASIGLGPNKLISKIASDLEKPDAFVAVTRAEAANFLRPLPVEKLRGVGKKNMVKLHSCGLRTIGDIARQNCSFMTAHFGEQGLYFWESAHGRGSDFIVCDTEPKSISNEHTFSQDTDSVADIRATLMFLSEKVSSRLRRNHLKGRTLTIKVRTAAFQTYSRSITLDIPTNFADTIHANIFSLYSKWATPGVKIRLLGVKVSKFPDALAVQEDLFTVDVGKKKEGVYSAIDEIRRKYGFNAIVYATRHITSLRDEQ